MNPRPVPFALLLTVATTVGCLPGPTRQFSDIGIKQNANSGTDASDNAMTTSDAGDGGMTNNDGGTSQQFSQVADIITTNCALGGCHGSPPAPNQVFSMPTGEDATDAEVEAALSTTNPTSSGNLLVSPNSPDMSEIYVRITKPDGDDQQMPPTGPLPMEDIMTIETWIANGAQY